ncbi:MAG: hypothetical protein ACI9QV_000790 [Methylophagaceae bacterium]|jgi:hypothetical protein
MAVSKMTDLVFHKAEKYIKEDLAYYFSGERDIHSQIKPGENIYSFTPDSSHLNIDYSDGKVGNLFFPFAPGSLDRIYIGISFPLFANNWGAAFLRHLMTLVKPTGCVVLPVYPEMQASEKNFWARSILENIFISRSRWKGMSNIWAENDGVMSMRIGRKNPPEIDSTANYLLRQGSQLLTRQSIRQADSKIREHQHFLDLHTSHWQNMQVSAFVEKIIQDHFGRKNAVQFCALGTDINNSLLATELLLSPYINIESARSQSQLSSLAIHDPRDLVDYYSRDLADKLEISTEQEKALASTTLNVISLINALSNLTSDEQSKIVAKVWQKLPTGGLLIVNENNPDFLVEHINALLTETGTIKHYSAIVASEHQADVDISHYSLIIEQELKEENQNKVGIFWVVQK